MKLIPRKNGKGFVSSYAAILGSIEARKAGFLDADGKSLELEKIVDEEAQTITIRIKSEPTE